MRLLYLIGHYFDGRIPTELDLVGLLRIQERTATGLLDDTSARNSDALRPAYQATLQAIFDAKVSHRAAHTSMRRQGQNQWTLPLGIQELMSDGVVLAFLVTGGVHTCNIGDIRNRVE